MHGLKHQAGCSHLHTRLPELVASWESQELKSVWDMISGLRQGRGREALQAPSGNTGMKIPWGGEQGCRKHYFTQFGTCVCKDIASALGKTPFGPGREECGLHRVLSGDVGSRPFMCIALYASCKPAP